MLQNSISSLTKTGGGGGGAPSFFKGNGSPEDEFPFASSIRIYEYCDRIT